MRLILLALLSMTAWADELTIAQIYPFGAVNPPASCSSYAQGSSYAAVSVDCVAPQGGYTGSAVAQAGIGPLGIGVLSDAFGTGGCVNGALCAFAEAISSWSNTIIPTGGDDQGFIQLDYRYTILGQGFVDIPNASFGSFNFGLGPLSFGDHEATTSLIPITFGSSYEVTLYARTRWFFDTEGPRGIEIEGAHFFDAAGNPITGSLVITPEPASWLLLGVPCLIMLWRRRGKFIS
jgi:hypothetical protein